MDLRATRPRDVHILPALHKSRSQGRPRARMWDALLPAGAAPAPAVGAPASPRTPAALQRQLSDLGRQLFVAACATVPAHRAGAASAEFPDGSIPTIRVGDEVDYLGANERWVAARVLDMHPGRSRSLPQVLVEPLEKRGRPEWLPFGTDFIAPRGSRVRPKSRAGAAKAALGRHDVRSSGAAPIGEHDGREALRPAAPTHAAPPLPRAHDGYDGSDSHGAHGAFDAYGAYGGHGGGYGGGYAGDYDGAYAGYTSWPATDLPPPPPPPPPPTCHSYQIVRLACAAGPSISVLGLPRRRRVFPLCTRSRVHLL